MKKIISLSMILFMLIPTVTGMGVNSNAIDFNGDNNIVSEGTGITSVSVEDTADADFYTWRMNGSELISSTENGATKNDLTFVSGNITNGVLKSAQITFEKSIRLKHDREWVIEWKSSGNWEGMLLASTLESPSVGLTYLFRHAATRIFSFGEYTGSWNNYGMTLDIDMSVAHVFRLENRIAEDGSNAVYLIIDGSEIDTMDHYYVTASNKNQRINWANGRDIEFANIGTKTHKITDMQLEYLSIMEDTHEHSYTETITHPSCDEQGYTTYTCSCGYNYKSDYVDALGGTHSWSTWTEITAPACDREGKDMRSCSVCGKAAYRDTRITGDSDKILVSNPLPEDHFNGKSIVTIGDSITHGVNTTKTYGEYLSEMLGVNVSNKGVSGSGYCSGGKMTTNDTLTEDNVKNADIVTIMLGVNDWAWSVKDGSWNGNPSYYDKSWTYYQLGSFDSTDTSTFYGALHSWCQNILRINRLEGFEDKQFYVITPLITSWNNSVGQRDWNQDKLNIHGHRFREYCTAIMEVCAYYDIPVFDANMLSGIYYKSATDNNIDLTGGDGVHVNAEGHALLADSLAEFLLENYSYEERSVNKGGHSYLNGTCESCRLPRKAPTLVETDNYTVTVNGIEDISEIRFVIGTFTTGSEIKAAEQNVTLDAATVNKYTVDGVFTYDLPWVGTYTFWVRLNDGSQYFLYTDVTEINPYVTSYGVKLTVNDFGENYKDAWLAKGTFNSYSEIKASGEFKYQASATKLDNYAKTTHDFTYTMEDPGDYTVLIRYNDGTYDVIHHTLTVDYPVLVENGLQVIVQNIPDIKIIRTAYGHYTSVADIKTAPTVRYFNNKTAIKNAEEYMIQYREEGEVTVIVEYNNGYKHYFYYNVAKKVPTVVQEGDTVTFGNLDDLYIIRYAPGKYTTANNIKNAPNSQYKKADSINENDEIVISDLTTGRWSFMVQYNDDSYNFYLLDIK